MDGKEVHRETKVFEIEPKETICYDLSCEYPISCEYGSYVNLKLLKNKTDDFSDTNEIGFVQFKIDVNTEKEDICQEIGYTVVSENEKVLDGSGEGFIFHKYHGTLCGVIKKGKNLLLILL